MSEKMISYRKLKGKAKLLNSMVIWRCICKFDNNIQMMRIISFLLASAVLFVSCKKDKFNTVPSISFKSMDQNVIVRGPATPENGPKLTINLTDAEGDFGKVNDSTISYVYVKNISAAPFKLDSFLFPDLSGLNRKNLDVDVTVQILRVVGSPLPVVRPHTDTLFFEVYVKDFAKNKSNVIITSDPVYYVTP